MTIEKSDMSSLPPLTLECLGNRWSENAVRYKGAAHSEALS